MTIKREYIFENYITGATETVEGESLKDAYHTLSIKQGWLWDHRATEVNWEKEQSSECRPRVAQDDFDEIVAA